MDKSVCTSEYLKINEYATNLLLSFTWDCGNLSHFTVFWFLSWPIMYSCLIFQKLTTNMYCINFQRGRPRVRVHTYIPMSRLHTCFLKKNFYHRNSQNCDPELVADSSGVYIWQHTKLCYYMAWPSCAGVWSFESPASKLDIPVTEVLGLDFLKYFLKYF